VEDIEKVIQFLEGEGLPFTWEEVGRAVERFGLGAEESPDASAKEAIVHEVISEGIRRSVAVAGKFLDLLGVPFPSRVDLSHDIEAQLSWGKKVGLWCLSRKRGLHLEVTVEVPGSVPGSVGATKRSLHLPDSKPLRAIGETALHIEPGRVVLRNSSYDPELMVTKGRAFFRLRTYEPKDLEGLKKASRKVKALAPFLSLMGVEDLREAIEALGELEVGEIRAEGPYVLVREERSLALRRGAIFGDPQLDGALLLERNVGLTFPGGVEVSFRPCWIRLYMTLHELKIRWKDEVFRGGEGFLADSLLRDPITKAIRNGLQREFERLESRPSSNPLRNVSAKMLAFLRAFASHEDPFQALAEGRFQAYVTAELFADL
jgi:hypothetical protein